MLKARARRRRAYRRRRIADRWLALIEAFPFKALSQIRPSRLFVHATVLAIGLSGVLSVALWNQRVLAANAAMYQQGDDPDDPFDNPAEARSAEPAPKIDTYVVQQGDTLFKIAGQFGISVATIAAANDLDDPDALSIGQELKLLPVSGVLHTIADGETLSQVANEYGIDPVQILEVNRLAMGVGDLLTGKLLVVPGIEPDIKIPLSKRVGFGGRPAPPSPVTYVVEEGDTVGLLADKFGVSIRTLLVANDLDDPDMLKVGLKLRVLPLSGVEHEVDEGESLADIAAAYKVDLGPIIDFNGIRDPDVLRVGDKLLIPGATARVYIPSAAQVAQAAEAAIASSSRSGSSGAGFASTSALPGLAGRSGPTVQAALVGAGGAGIVRNAMQYLGYRYVFGGTTPSGFDCSGFVYYIHRVSGAGTSRGMWGQMNGGPRISRENLLPGDVVFFANTYMPGLSHDGIYIGGGRFIHAADESSGVSISSLGDPYWSSRYVGASRLW